MPPLTGLSGLSGLSAEVGGGAFRWQDVPNTVLYAPSEGAAAGAVWDEPNTHPAAFAGTGAAPAWLTGAGNFPTISGAPADGLTGSLQFGTAGASSYLSLSSSISLAATVIGVGKLSIGGWAIEWWQYLPSSLSIASYKLAWGRLDGNQDVYWDSGVWDAYGFGIPADQRSAGAPTRDAWVWCCMNLYPWQKGELFENNVSVLAFNWTNSVTFDAFGGVTASAVYNPVGLKACGLRIYNRPLTPYQRGRRVLGLPINLLPIRWIPMDDNAGTTPRDKTLSVVQGGAVGSIANLANGARPLANATAGEKPVYVINGVAYPADGENAPPADQIPPVIGGSARFDKTDDNLFDTGLLGAAEANLSVLTRGRVEAFYDGTTYNTRKYFFAASKDNTFDLTNGSASECVLLGDRMGSAASPAEESGVELVIKPAGGNAIRIQGDKPHGLGRDVGFRIQGGVKAELLQDGVVTGSLVSGTIPGTLDLHAKSGLGLGGAPEGHEHRHIIVARTFLTDAHHAGLRKVWDSDSPITPAYHKRLKDNGGFGSGSNRHGYAIGTSAWHDTASGRYHAFYTAGPGDPSQQDILYMTSQDRRTWVDRGVFKTDDPAAVNSWSTLGNTIIKMAGGTHANRLLMYGGKAPATTPFTPWVPYVWYSDDPDANPPTWTEAIVNGDGSLTGADYWFLHGRMYEVSPGVIRCMGYGLRTGDTQLSTWFLQSTDGINFTILKHVTSASGNANGYMVEPSFIYLDPGTWNEIVLYCRVSGTGKVTTTKNATTAGGDWTLPIYAGENATMPTAIQPDFHPCSDVAGDAILFLGVRSGITANTPPDPSLRWGLVAARARNGQIGNPVSIVPEVNGIVYQSFRSVGVVNGKHMVGGIYSADSGNPYYIEFAEEDIPWLPN